MVFLLKKYIEKNVSDMYILKVLFETFIILIIKFLDSIHLFFLFIKKH